MHAELATSLAITPTCPRRWLLLGQALDSRQRRVLAPAHLVYDGQHILYFGSTPPPAGVLRPEQRAPDASLPDALALPGLIEGHSHVFLAGTELNVERRTEYQKQDAATLLALAEQRIQTLGRLGVVAMRDGGDKDQVGLGLSRLTANGSAPAWAARVFSPGAAINRQGRYGSFFSRAVEEFSDGEQCVASRVQEGADHIKLVPTGIISFAKGQVVGLPQFSSEEITRLTSAAASHGKHVMAHASGDLGVGNALAGGVNTIEHGFFVTDEQLAQMRDRQVAWLPTFSPVQEQVDHADVMGWTGVTFDNLQKILDNHARALGKALALGVNVLVGSDAGSCGVTHGIGLIRELELLQQAGMPVLDILSQVTHGNNQALIGAQPLGTLEAGTRARFILASSAVLDRVARLGEPRLVIWDGAVQDTAAVPVDGL